MMDNRLSFQERNKVASQWASKLILLGLVFIIVSTLYPFKFSWTGISALSEILRNFRIPSSFRDIQANILLFMPLGFGLACAIAKRHYPFFTKLLAVFLLCGALSLGVELLQVFLPGRDPSPIDVFSNASGGAVGFLCFHYFGTLLFTIAISLGRVARAWLSKLSLSHLLIGLAIYVVFAGWLLFFWQSGSLRGWESNLYLSIGSSDKQNERPLGQEIVPSWSGTLADLIISDRALAKDQAKTFFTNPSGFLQNNPSVLATYSLRSAEGTKDSVGQAPNLVEQGKQSASFSPQGVTLSAGQQLLSSQPIDPIVNQIRDTSTFTISALITPSDLSRLGLRPQQILALTPPFTKANFSIRQFQSNLQVTLVYSRTTRGQRLYRVIFPNVFSGTRPHRLLITYSGFVLRVYVDGVEQAYMTDITPNRFQIMFYLLILFPLGVLITLVASRLKHRVLIYLFLIGGGAILPSFLIEGFWMIVGERNFRISNLLLGILIVGGTIVGSQGNPLQALKSARSGLKLVN